MGVKILRTTGTGLDKLLSGTAMLGTVIVLLISLLIAVLVFGRFVLNVEVRGTLDVIIYSVVIFPSLTVAYIQREREHITVVALTSRFTERAQTALRISVYLVAVVYPIIFMWKVLEWLSVLFGSGQLTIAVWAIPKSILVSIMAFGMLLLIMQTIRMLIHDIRSLPGQASTGKLKDNPWLYVALFSTGIVVALLLFTQLNPVLGLIFFVLFLIFAGMPVFYTLGVAGILGLYLLIGPQALVQAPYAAFGHLYSYPITCLPLFIVGGVIMERSKIADHVFTLFESLVGNFPTAPLVVVILVGGFFCAVSGSTVGATAIVAAVALPILISRGYRKDLSCGIVAAASVGTLIPPSIGYVVYGILTEVSIGELFIATLIPAALLFTFYFLYVFIRGTVSKGSLFEGGRVVTSEISPWQVSWRDRLALFKKAVWGLLTPFIVLGGIYAGVFTPTDAAGVFVIYAIIVAVFITKALKWRDVLEASFRGAMISSMLLCILFAAFGLALVIVHLRIAQSLTEYATAAGFGQLGVLGFVFIVLFILGMFMSGEIVKVITLPVFFPLALVVGIDPLWFGVFYQVTVEIATLTPPVGMCLFVIAGVSGIPLPTIVKGVFPFVLIFMFLLVVLYLFPELVTWLPSTMK